MGILGSLHLTLADHINRMTPAGSIERDIIEISAQINPILNYMPFIEGNLTTGNRAIIRTDMPGVAWTAIGQPVLPGKSGTKQVDDTTAKVKALSHIPLELAQLNGNTAAFRLSEQIPHIEAMNQEATTALFYHNSQLDPKKPLGLSPRYNALATRNVYDGGARDAQAVTSMWLMCLSPLTFHGIFPKGIPGGLQHRGKEQPQTYGDDTNGYVEVLEDWYEWQIGFQLKDWRYVMRYCNISTQTSGGNVIDLEILNTMYRQIPNPNFGPCVWACNRTVATQMDNLAMNKQNVMFTIEEFEGRPITKYRGFPVVVNDAILNTEDVVT